tara:strand:+ start:2673 stop:3593 length:921 start_codon:yes stop_codon:yes gene_type:complete
MKIYIQRPEAICAYGAWTWVIKGYVSAWEARGYEVAQYDHLEQIDVSQEFELMTYDIYIRNIKGLEVLSKAKRAYVFVGPNNFPSPWGEHPNWLSPLPDSFIQSINEMDNVYLWCWQHADRTDYYTKWKKIKRVGMAFDHINYRPVRDSRLEFDVCYIGSWANNGLNEKKKIMIKHFAALKKLNLKCGFFINQGLNKFSIQQEANVLFNSKITINLHDNYQRILGLDHNERTYKSLGANGFLISDKVAIVEEDFPNVPIAETPEEMASLVTKYLDVDLEEEKVKNRQNILDNHTYINRVEQLISLT